MYLRQVQKSKIKRKLVRAATSVPINHRRFLGISRTDPAIRPALRHFHPSYGYHGMSNYERNNGAEVESGDRIRRTNSEE